MGDGVRGEDPTRVVVTTGTSRGGAFAAIVGGRSSALGGVAEWGVVGGGEVVFFTVGPQEAGSYIDEEREGGEGGPLLDGGDVEARGAVFLQGENKGGGLERGLGFGEGDEGKEGGEDEEMVIMERGSH